MTKTFTKLKQLREYIPTLAWNLAQHLTQEIERRTMAMVSTPIGQNSRVPVNELFMLCSLITMDDMKTEKRCTLPKAI